MMSFTVRKGYLGLVRRVATPGSSQATKNGSSVSGQTIYPVETRVRFVFMRPISPANASSFSGYSAVDVVPAPGQSRIKIRAFTEAKVEYSGYYTRFAGGLEYIGK
jgi:hypothetical protein